MGHIPDPLASSMMFFAPGNINFTHYCASKDCLMDCSLRVQMAHSIDGIYIDLFSMMGKRDGDLADIRPGVSEELCRGSFDL